MGVRENIQEKIEDFKCKQREDAALKKAEKTAYEGTYRKERAPARIKEAIRQGELKAKAEASASSSQYRPSTPQQSKSKKAGRKPKRINPRDVRTALVGRPVSGSGLGNLGMDVFGQDNRMGRPSPLDEPRRQQPKARRTKTRRPRSKSRNSTKPNRGSMFSLDFDI